VSSDSDGADLHLLYARQQPAFLKRNLLPYGLGDRRVASDMTQALIVANKSSGKRHFC